MTTTPERPVIEDLYPLTALQQGMLFHSRLAPGSGVYVVQYGLRIEGRLDHRAFAHAWELTVARHAALRTSVLVDEAAEPIAMVTGAVRAPLEILDWRNLDEPSRTTALDELLASDRTCGIDVERAPLARLTLVQFDDHSHQLLWTYHHLVLDGWSLPLVLHDLFTAYDADLRGTPPSLPERRPFRDYVAWLATRDLAADEAYWRDRLQGFADPTPLGVDRDTGDHGHSTYRTWLPAETTTALAGFARRSHVTLNTVVQGAWARLLAWYSGEDDVVFGVTTSGRTEDLADATSMVGLFINTTPLRARVDPDPDHDLVGWLGSLQSEQALARRHEHTPLADIQRWTEVPPGRPLFDSLLVFESYPADEVTVPGLRLENNLGHEQTNYPLTVLVGTGDRLSLGFDYDRALFDRPTIERLATHLAAALRGMTSAPPDLALAIDERNATAAPSPAAPVHRSVTGEGVAVVCGSASLTYAELEARSNQFAHHLRHLGVVPESVVAVELERGVDVLVALLGTWKAGGAFLPLDPSFPRSRTAGMVADASALVADLTGIDDLPTTPLDVRTEWDQLAYVLFTSGSTGRPKGVGVPHRGLANRLGWMCDTYAFGPGDRVLHKTALTFDVSLWELVAPLLVGGCVVMAEPGHEGDVDNLAGLIRDQGVTVAHFVPSMFHAFADVEAPSLRLVVCSGEALRGDDVERFYARNPHAVVENLYGPTEASIDVSSWTCPRGAGGSPPIGQPIANTRLHVRSPSQRPAPVGELFIGGAGLARGYMGRPDLTAERFVAADGGERLYRTGDRVRWNTEHQLEFLGRLDDQVKVRGFRVEPTEIEAALVRHPEITDAAVVARDDRLVGYLVPAVPADVVAHLRATLPDYMVPGQYAALDSLPVTTSGKLDRRSLPAPNVTSRGSGPRNPTEQIVAGIWRDLLGLATVGIADDFFELGGHSLLATRLVSQLRRELDVELPLAAFFDHPTVAGLAAVIDRTVRGSERAPVVPLEGASALSSAQQRLWFLDQFEPGGTEYNLTLTLRASGSVDPDRLEAAFAEIVARHEVLRTRFVAVDGTPTAVVEPPGRFGFTRDMDGPFDLAAGPPLRVSFADGVLRVVMHHIVGDQWSLGVLLRELSVLYAGGELPALPVQYRDFAAWQQALDLDDQLAYWRERLAGGPVLDLPTDRPRPAVRSSAGDAINVELDVVRVPGSTVFMTVLAAFSVVLGRWAGTEDVVTGVPVAGRDRPEVQDLIGLFVNTSVLRTDLSGDPTFGELVGRVRSTVLAAHAHQDVPFERLVDALQPERDRSRTPLFQVLVDYAEALELGHLGLEEVGTPRDTTLFDLTLVVTDTGATIEYSTELFDRSTVERLAEHLSVVLAVGPSVRLSEIVLPDPVVSVGATLPVPAVPAHELVAGAGVAVIDGDGSLSYEELDRRSNRFARYLLDRGVGPEDLVGLELSRGVDVVVGMVGVWKAGAAFVPVDPDYPPERRELMAAGTRLVVTDATVVEGSSDPVGVVVHPDQLAAVIFTSGSTGVPKGVGVTHRNLAGVLGGWRHCQFDRPLRWLSVTSASFDVFVGDVLRGLSGGSLVIGPTGLQLDPVEWSAFMTAHGVEAMECAPRFIDQLDHRGLELLVATTDTWWDTRAVEAGERLGCRLLAGFGITEATIDSTYSVLDGIEPVGRATAIGLPLPNTEIRVLDPSLNPLPVGVPGELYIGGIGVTRGYIDQPVLTAERFIATDGGQRLYRSGDRVVWRSDGQLAFLGRRDRQLNHHGYRIEPGEVEAALTQQAPQAFVTTHDDRLVAYVTGPIDRHRLSRTLPAHLVPNLIIELDTLPTTPHGKIDHTALPTPTPTPTTHAYTSPTTPTEATIAHVWADLLAVERVGTHDNFFNLGGHSLLATQIVSRLRVAFAIEIPLAVIFDHPVVTDLATIIDSMSGTSWESDQATAAYEEFEI